MRRTTFEEDLVATTIDYINSHPELTEEDINVIWEATSMSVRYYASHSVVTEEQSRKKLKEFERNLKISEPKTV